MAHTGRSRLAVANGPKPSASFAPAPLKSASSDLCLLRALVSKDYTTANKVAQRVEKAAMGEANGLQGGYIVPTGYSTALMDAWSERPFIRPRATVIEMTSRTAYCPYVNAETVQAAGTSPFFGGIVFNWGKASGTSTVAETEPTINALSLTACDLIGDLVLSNQLVMDGGEAGELAWMKLFGRAAAYYEEYAFINGLGVDSNQPVGILHADAAENVSRTTSDEIVAADVAAMSACMMPQSWAYAIWAVSPTALAQLVTITGFVPNMDALAVEKGCVGTLLCRPVYVTDKLPQLGTVGDLVFFDPSAYVVGNRQDIIIDSSSQGPATFGTNQTMFRVWLRTAGLPLFRRPITLTDGTTIVSPFVILN